MLRCNDPVLIYLSHFGFNVIRLPREGITPGLVMVGKGPELMRLGELKKIWETNMDFPEPMPPCAAAFLDGRRTQQFSAKTGIEIMEQLLGTFKLDAPRLAAVTSSAKKFEFGFGNPEIWSIDLFDLGSFIANGKLPENNPVIKRYTKDEAILHVITDVLLSSSLSIQLSTDTEKSLQLDLESLQKVVNMDVNLDIKNNYTSSLLFKGDRKLAFGFRALQISYSNEEWVVKGMAKPGSIFQASPPPPSKWASIFPLGETIIIDSAN